MRRLCLLAGGLLVASCATGPNGQSFTPEQNDASLDQLAEGSADAKPEIAIVDSGPEAHDVVAELAFEAAPDAIPDSSLDTQPPEASAEPNPESGIDALPDTSQEAAPDALPDLGTEPTQEAAPDVVLDVPKDVPLDGPAGPVDPGVYSYSIVPSYSLLNPAAVAWHPTANYALVLNANNKVYRFDPVPKSLTEVATTSNSLAWRAVRFAPGGSKAVLLGNDNTAKEGRIYLWDDATSQLSDMSSEHFAGGTYEAVAWDPTGTTARLLGAKSNPNIVYVWEFDVGAGRSNVKATNSNAGCQDLAWATDSFNAPALAIVCGVNGVDLLQLNGGGQFVHATGNAGNTSRVSGRPQGDYALAICWSCNSKIYRFQQGAWETPYSSPTVLGGYQIGFSTDGRRALVLGGYSGSGQKGQVYEYRHALLVQSEIYDVSIPNFGSAPYLADSSVELNGVAWRPGCEEGLIVGGANTLTSQKGYLIEFSVDNGIQCY